jgi:hypothetical protein
MNEPKTRCKQCNRSILQRTADKREGFCAICHCRQPNIPPDDFEIPAPHAERIKAIGLDPTNYVQKAWDEKSQSFSDSDDPFEKLVSNLEDRAARYLKWLPEVREFANACGRKNPNITPESCDKIELVKQKIFADKVQIEQRLHSTGSHTVYFFCLPFLGISAVSETAVP